MNILPAKYLYQILLKKDQEEVDCYCSFQTFQPKLKGKELLSAYKHISNFLGEKIKNTTIVPHILTLLLLGFLS